MVEVVGCLNVNIDFRLSLVLKSAHRLGIIQNYKLTSMMFSKIRQFLFIFYFFNVVRVQ